ARKIRRGWIDGGGKLTGQVEVDETYVRGKERIQHASKLLKAGRGAVGMTAVIGAKERDSKVKARVIGKTDSATLKGFVVENVETGADIFAKEHSVGQYVN